jgi:predicted phage terminase large subunit-like protein
MGDPRVRICPITPKLDKALRLEAATAELEDASFLLPINVPWLKAFRLECMAFPRARHDDQVYSLSQFILWQKVHKSALAAVYVPHKKTMRRQLRPNN